MSPLCSHLFKREITLVISCFSVIIIFFPEELIPLEVTVTLIPLEVTVTDKLLFFKPITLRKAKFV